MCGYVKEVISLLPVHSSLLPSLSTILQHHLTSSQNTPLPKELEAIQLEMDKICKEQEEEKEREREREEREREKREREEKELSEAAEGVSSSAVVESDVKTPSQDSPDSAAVGEDVLEAAESSGELQPSGGPLEVTPAVDEVDGCLSLDTPVPPMSSVESTDQPSSHVTQSQPISDGCGVDNDLEDGMLHKRPVAHGRTHRKSNSWSGIPDDIIVGPS